MQWYCCSQSDWNICFLVFCSFLDCLHRKILSPHQAALLFPSHFCAHWDLLCIKLNVFSPPGRCSFKIFDGVIENLTDLHHCMQLGCSIVVAAEQLDSCWVTGLQDVIIVVAEKLLGDRRAWSRQQWHGWDCHRGRPGLVFGIPEVDLPEENGDSITNLQKLQLYRVSEIFLVWEQGLEVSTNEDTN